MRRTPSTPLAVTTARTFGLGLGAARLLEGLAEVVATRRFLSAIGAHPDPSPGTLMGFRMKGGRDVALGLHALAALGDDRRLARALAAAVVVDGVDGLAAALDRGRTFGPPVHPAGAVLGFLVAGAAVAAAQALSGDRR